MLAVDIVLEIGQVRQGLNDFIKDNNFVFNTMQMFNKTNIFIYIY